MSYDVTFKGELEFANRDCLVAGVAWMVRFAEMSMFHVDIDGLRATLDADTSMSAGAYSDMLNGLRSLAGYAYGGRIETTFKGEGMSRETIRHGYCDTASFEGLSANLLSIARDWIRNKDPKAPAAD